MNFFEYQDQARRQSRRLVFLFILAVIAIIVVIDFAVLLAFGILEPDTRQGLVSVNSLKSNFPTLMAGALVTLVVIGVASLFKTAVLSAGGGKVARDLGGALVEADSRDPLKRRLYNVVEEIALASGIPVPEIYVLEQESGINAFAAGFTPADAAVAVTRGALEKLNRGELQGVIAHEFSHIFNGDMRLNIRLMGALFGIMVLALIGRRVIRGSFFMGRSRNNNGGAVMLVAVAVMLVGYVGLFFGRWIKAAVSRQREYLADASAVQFTRDPGGIAGALKKIAVYSDASYLHAESEEVSHMLFGDGQKMHMFSTHPPLDDRIRRIDKSFQPDDLVRLAKRIQREGENQAVMAAREQQKASRGEPGWFDGGQLVDQIGNPDLSRILMAAALAASIPDELSRAAHSTAWASEVLLYCLLDRDDEIRERQLLSIAEQLGSDSETRVRGLLHAAPELGAEQRLPLLEIAFPELKRRPPAQVTKLLATVNALVEADGRTEVFEYLLAKMIAQHLWESSNPRQVRMAGNKSLQQCTDRVRNVLAVLAAHGHVDPEAAATAYRAGMTALGETGLTPAPVQADWCGALDDALPGLDQLRPADKQKLVQALVATVTSDQQVVVEELELLRVVCAVIHVPLPIVNTAAMA